MNKILMAENSIITGNVSRVGGHQYSRLFSQKGIDTFYLSPPVSLFHLFNFQNKKHTLNRFKVWAKGGIKINNYLEEYVPFSFFPLKNLPLMKNQFFIDNTLNYTLPDIKNILRKKGFLNVDILLISELYLYQLAEFVNYKLLIYRKTDDYQYFKGYPKSLLKKEKELINKADIVFVTAKKIKKDLELSYNKKIHYLPNGVESARFTSQNISFPDEFKNIPKPRIIYIGTISSWFDKDLIKFCAFQNPKLNFIVIGPSSINMSDLKSYKNIYILGGIPYDEVPSYLINSDVGIIPLRIDNLSRSINPVKLYEYLAAGLPVVSSFFEDLKELQDVIFMAQDKKEFSHFLAEALRKKDKERYKKLAQENTWEKRFEKMLKIINIVLNKKYANSENH